nr:nicotinate-nucleotide adenylyltransferase [Chloroflexota bacterium]
MNWSGNKVKRRIGVFGGTFDPIHYGHLVITEDARVYLQLEKVLFVPARQPPHKAQGSYSAFQHRVRMTELAIADNPHFVLSLIEAERPGPSYTVDTLRQLRAEFGPDVDLYFIIGMDSLANIESWYKPAELLTLCRIVVAERAGYHVDLSALEEALPGLRNKLELIDTPELSISSTDLQRRVRSGLAIRYQLPSQVEKYIYEHRLYLDEEAQGDASFWQGTLR